MISPALNVPGKLLIEFWRLWMFVGQKGIMNSHLIGRRITRLFSAKVAKRFHLGRQVLIPKTTIQLVMMSMNMQ